MEYQKAKLHGDEAALEVCQARVTCFTEQLNAANPILNEISAAMTQEGLCQQKMKEAEQHGSTDLAAEWQTKLDEAGKRKALANSQLLECSSYYQKQMRLIREKAM